MTDHNKQRTGDYLRSHGEALINQGYSIVPIPPGRKGPMFEGWQNTRSTPAALNRWLEEDKGSHGVGILTRETPAIDIDVLDEEVASTVLGWCEELFPDTCRRVGRAPKVLLVFRTDSPFKKMRSAKWSDEWGADHQIEILGDGQQFVAYATHPGTLRPYEWVHGGQPVNIAAADLPLLDLDKVNELIRRFDGLASEMGWTLKSKSRRPLDSAGLDIDDPFIEDAPPIEMSADKLRERLMMIPVDVIDDHDQWFQVGMALHHQFDGSEEGLALWHDWSEMGSNYGADQLDERWKSFAIQGKQRAPTTARFILKLAKDAAETLTIQVQQELQDAFSQSRDLASWEAACTRARKAEVDFVAREGLTDLAASAYHRITGAKVPKPVVRKKIAYTMNTKDAPRWCRPWVYDAAVDRFVNVDTKFAASLQGFNAMHDRYALTKADILDGRETGKAKASELALNAYQIPVVVGQRYQPGEDAIFYQHGQRYANTYTEVDVPALPEKITPRDKRNVGRVKAHIAHLIEDEREQRIFLDWIAYVVSNPDKRVNWAVLLQGVEGDGKSFWGVLARAVMGHSNVRMLNGSMLEERFTGWAEGQCLVCVEEIRMVGHNRYDALNRMKPLIANEVIEVHPKGQPSRDIENTSSYILFTNYKDALPLTDNDRRYCVIFSRWQHGEQLRRFLVDQPSYYRDLYAAVAESAGAIRAWLIGHEPAEDFDARARAPLTKWRGLMATASRPDFISFLSECFEDDHHADICPDVINVTKAAELYRLSGAKDDLPAKRMAMLMEAAGFHFVGRFRLERGGDKVRVYSAAEENFASSSAAATWCSAVVGRREKRIDAQKKREPGEDSGFSDLAEKEEIEIDL